MKTENFNETDKDNPNTMKYKYKKQLFTCS